MFLATDIVEDVKNAILIELNNLEKKAIAQNYGPEIRFAVRSSGNYRGLPIII